jgi:hypothetical protein
MPQWLKNGTCGVLDRYMVLPGTILGSLNLLRIASTSSATAGRLATIVVEMRSTSAEPPSMKRQSTARLETAAGSVIEIAGFSRRRTAYIDPSQHL